MRLREQATRQHVCAAWVHMPHLCLPHALEDGVLMKGRVGEEEPWWSRVGHRPAGRAKESLTLCQPQRAAEWFALLSHAPRYVGGILREVEVQRCSLLHASLHRLVQPHETTLRLVVWRTPVSPAQRHFLLPVLQAMFARVLFVPRGGAEAEMLVLVRTADEWCNASAVAISTATDVNSSSDAGGRRELYTRWSLYQTL